MTSERYFEQVADRWDLMRQGFFSDRLRDEAMAAADVQPGKTAADIGAGSGFITEGLVRKGLRVVAVDRSKAMAEVLEEKFRTFDTVECRIGTADALPLDNEEVTYVFANMVLHHVEAPFEAIKEMVRTLQPGGRLVITDLNEHNAEFFRTEHHDRWLGFKQVDVQDWFVNAGLRNVKIEDMGERCCTDSNCTCGSEIVTVFIAVGEK